MAQNRQENSVFGTAALLLVLGLRTSRIQFITWTKCQVPEMEAGHSFTMVIFIAWSNTVVVALAIVSKFSKLKS
uniref:Uncharacterized protein n=1 Tax=Arundo donax TaxID=35708 RepID=A0A0A9LCF0_ARUDO